MELLRIDYDMAQSEVSEKIKDDAGTVYINNSEQVLKVGVRPNRPALSLLLNIPGPNI